MNRDVLNAVLNTIEYCSSNSYCSFDLFDALESPIISKINSILIKRIFLQSFSISPVNIRPLLGIKKSIVPKTISDLLSAVIKLEKLNIPVDKNLKVQLKNKLISLSIPGYKGLCWGLPFGFASRKGLMKKNMPNVINTYYAISSLLDYYETFNDKESLQLSIKSIPFFLDDVGYVNYDDTICFGYYPTSLNPIHNSNLLVSSLLSRIACNTERKELLELSKKGIRFSVHNQKPDGSWSYGEDPGLEWIDNFHTGYNLEAIFDYQRFSKDDSFKKVLQNGFNFYLNNLFTYDSIPKYYNNKKYPVDSQTIAQSIQTLAKLSIINSTATEMLDKVVAYTLKNFYNPKGYFYFRKYPLFKIRIPYFRWSSSTITLALTSYLDWENHS